MVTHFIFMSSSYSLGTRILFAEFGTEKILTIEKTLKKYGHLSASQLVELTHRENAPWSITPKSSFFNYSPIELETIKKNHKFEVL